MIQTKVLEEVIFNTIKRGSCQLSPDIHGAFEQAIACLLNMLSFALFACAHCFGFYQIISVIFCFPVLSGIFF